MTVSKDMALMVVANLGDLVANSRPDDFVLSTTDPSQSILIGTSGTAFSAAQTISDKLVQLDRLVNISCNVQMASGTTLFSSALSNAGTLSTQSLTAQTASLSVLTASNLRTVTLSNSDGISTKTLVASNILSSVPGGLCNVGSNTYTTTLSNAGNASFAGVLSTSSNLLLTTADKRSAVALSSSNNGLVVGGDVIIQGALTVNTVTFLQSNLTVYSSETVQSNLFVQSTTTTCNLVVPMLATTGTLSNTGQMSTSSLVVGSTLSNLGNASVGGVLATGSISNAGNAVLAGYTSTSILCNAGTLVSSNVYAAGGGLYGSSFSNLPNGTTYLMTLSNAGSATFAGPVSTASITNSAGISSSNVSASGGLFGPGFSNVGLATYTSTLCNAGAAFFGGTITASNLVTTGPAAFSGTMSTSTLCNSGNLVSSNLFASGGGIYGTGFSNLPNGSTYLLNSSNAGTSTVAGLLTAGAGLVVAAGETFTTGLSNTGTLASTSVYVASTGGLYGPGFSNVAGQTYAANLSAMTLSNSGNLVSCNLYAAGGGIYGTGFSNLPNGATYLLNSSNAGTSTVAGLLTAGAGLVVTSGETVTQGLSNTGDLVSTNIYAAGGGVYGSGFSNVAGQTYAAVLATATLSNSGQATFTGGLSTVNQFNSGTVTSSNVVVSGGGLFGTAFSNLPSGITYTGTLSNALGLAVGGAASIGDGLKLSSVAAGGSVSLTATACNGLFVGGPVTINGDLTVNSVSYFRSNVTIFSSETIYSNMNVDGTLWSCNLSVSNLATINTLSNTGNVSVGGQLAVGGDLGVAGTLRAVTFSNASNLTSYNMYATNALYGTSFCNLADGTTHAGSVISGVLSNTGNASVAGVLATGSIVNSGSLTSSNVTTLGGGFFGAGFSNTPDGKTYLATLVNAGPASFGGPVVAAAGMFGASFSNLSNGSTYAGALAVAGVVTSTAFSNSAAAPGTLFTSTVSNAANTAIGCNLLVAGNIQFLGTLLQGSNPVVSSQWTSYSNALSNGVYFTAGAVNAANLLATNATVSSNLILSNLGDGTAVVMSTCNAVLDVTGGVVVSDKLRVINQATVGGLIIKRANQSNSGSSAVVTSMQGYSNDYTGIVEYFTARSNTDSFRFTVSNAGVGEVMRLTADGRLGLGTSNPQHTLSVVGDLSVGATSANGGGFTLISTSNGIAQYIASAATAGDTDCNTTHAWYANGTADAASCNLLMALDYAGRLVARGSVTTYGDVYAHSDARLKTALQPIDNALQRVSGIVGYTYERCDDRPGQVPQRHTGVLAQDVLRVLPEAVDTVSSPMMSVAYGNLAGLFTEAIKELAEQVKQQAARIAVLESAASAPPSKGKGPKK